MCRGPGGPDQGTQPAPHPHRVWGWSLSCLSVMAPGTPAPTPRNARNPLPNSRLPSLQNLLLPSPRHPSAPAFQECALSWHHQGQEPSANPRHIHHSRVAQGGPRSGPDEAPAPTCPFGQDERVDGRTATVRRGGKGAEQDTRHRRPSKRAVPGILAKPLYIQKSGRSGSSACLMGRRVRRADGVCCCW